MECNAVFLENFDADKGVYNLIVKCRLSSIIL